MSRMETHVKNERTRRGVLVALLATWLAAGCAARPNEALVFTIEQALITAPQGADFARSIPGDWDRLCVFRPYTTYAQVDSVIGAPWRDVRSSGIEMGDAATLLTFVRGTAVSEWVLYPRAKGDWGTPGPEQWYCRTRDNAVFQLRQPFDGGIPWIGPADGR
jgi:hypothetical protein